jgi:hypothetical protein
MKAILYVKCDQCKKQIGEIPIDMADMPMSLEAPRVSPWKIYGRKTNEIIMAHQGECPYNQGGIAGF